MKILAPLLLALTSGIVTAESDTSPYPENLLLMGVDRVHKELGVKGAGVKVGISSTGVNYEHEALINNYAGRQQDGSFDHNYAWYESSLGRKPVPHDGLNVGTHLTGVVVGSANHIGVAPEAKFISCKSIDDLGRDTPETQNRCLNFMASPHDLNGENPHPDLRPDVVLTPYSESSNGDVLAEAIQQLKEAGVVVIAPAGPKPPGMSPCIRQMKAPSYYPNVFTVGASQFVDGKMSLLDTSGGGPVVIDGELVSYIKPDAVAPGKSQVSSVYLDNTNLYFAASGTPVAAANMAGIAALVISSNPALKRRPSDVEEILRHAADPTDLATTDCVSQQSSPNNVTGAGSVNAYAAVKRAMEFPYGGCPVMPVEPGNCTDASESSLTVSRRIPRNGLEAKAKQLNFVHRAPWLNLGDFGELKGRSGDYLSLCVYDTPKAFHGDPSPLLKEGFKIPFGRQGNWEWEREGNWLSAEARPRKGEDGIRKVRINARKGTIDISGFGTELPLSRSTGNAALAKVFDVAPELTVQLHSSETGACWNSTFTAENVLENDNVRFRARMKGD